LALASAFSLTVLRGGLTRYFGAVGQSVAMLLIVATWTLALSYVAHMVLHPDLEPVLFLFRNLAISLILTGLLLRYLYVQHLNKVQEAAETRSRFQALQSRIRPHFLFNSMNTIASLTRLDPIKAEQVVEDLADLFRASLTDAEKLATLDEELDLARRYLNIERIRLGDRIRIEWKVADLPKTAVLPRLTLQPLLENAVYHGIEKHPEGGEITLCGSCQHGVVELKLCNPLFHEEISASGREKHGIALNNVKQRLETLFGVSGRLLIKEDRDRYCVTLNFPDTLDEDSHSR
jgi:two-component system sensor histidine kinase AlgZ